MRAYQALKRAGIALFDAAGLVTADRDGLSPSQRDYARDIGARRTWPRRCRTAASPP